MDIDGLNRLLFALSPSEQAYLSGASFDWNRNSREFATKQHPVRIMDDRATLSDTNSWRVRAPHFDHADMPLRGRFLIRPTSRFNPAPEHVHSYMEINYVYSGTCPQHVNGRDMPLKENQVLLLDTNCPHAVERLERSDIMLSLVITKDYLTQLLADSFNHDSLLVQFLINVFNEQVSHNRYIRFHTQDNRRIRRFFQELLCEYYDPSSCAETIILHLLRLILAELINVYEEQYTQRELANCAQRVSVIPIIRYIERNYLICTQESVAKHFYISPNYVSTLLKKHTGMTYRQAIQAQKLGHAAAMLRNTTLPIADVAKQSGYENQSFFYRKFKERYGMLPAAYRAQCQASL